MGASGLTAPIIAFLLPSVFVVPDGDVGRVIWLALDLISMGPLPKHFQISRRMVPFLKLRISPWVS